jgi:hypothetical protein
MPRTIKSEGGGKRHPLNMRTTKETRERLAAAASANGRSLAQEVEIRLERSFDVRPVMNVVAAGERIGQGLMKLNALQGELYDLAEALAEMQQREHGDKARGIARELTPVQQTIYAARNALLGAYDGKGDAQ